MAARGRKPKPTALRLLEGNPGKRPLPADEPKPGLVVPRCPPELSDEAKREWRRVTGEFAALGMVSRLDRAGLATYCEAWAHWLDAQEKLRKFGVVIQGKGGRAIPSPYLSVARQSFREMLALLSEFGMTPAGRTRVASQPAPQPSDDFFA